MEKVKWEECREGDRVVAWIGKKDGTFEEVAGRYHIELGYYKDVVSVRKGFFKHCVIDGRTGIILGIGRTPAKAKADALNLNTTKRILQSILYRSSRAEYERKLDMWIKYGRAVFSGMDAFMTSTGLESTPQTEFEFEFDPEVKPDGVLH